VSFLDKAKAAAAKVTAEAQKGAAQVHEKVEKTHTRHKADDLAKQLGYLIVRERTGGGSAGEEADGLVSQIAALEAQLAAEHEEEPAPDAQGPTPNASTPSAPSAPAVEPGANVVTPD
jgi:hypothetical protein